MDKSKQILKEIKSFVESPVPRIDAMKKTVSLLKNNFPRYNWVGIYLRENDELILGPYLGKPTPHTRIKLDQGICGAAVREGQTILVSNVNEDPRYLACSLETKSEIVVPIKNEDRIVGEIDIDSDTPNAFDKRDQEFLEEVSLLLATRW